MMRQGRRTGAVAVVVAVVLASLTAVGGSAGAASSAKAKSYESTVKLTVTDLQDWWAQTMPTVYGVDYTPIPASKVIAYTSKTKIPQCGPKKVTYADVAENAFYCNAGKFVAYDDQQLFPELAAKFGDFTIALTLAHEWGHAIQDQAGLTGPTIAMEQQADCFAGAWVRHVADGESENLSLNEGNLDAGLAGYLTFRDPPGSDPTADGAHGSAFDRVSAFQEGYDGGATRCKDFETNPPELTDIPFSSQAEAKSGGNAPFREVLPATAADLDAYWSGLLSDYESVALKSFEAARARPKCGSVALGKEDQIAYCPKTNTIVYDSRLFPGVYQRSGDFGVAVVVAAEWAVAMQDLEGVEGDAKALELQQSCFTGSWAGSVARGEHNPDGTGLALSPGDLDEAIQSYLIFREPKKIEIGSGATAFENVDAFRTGFFLGEQACLDFVPGSAS
jgi:predicted metalloprotease